MLRRYTVASALIMAVSLASAGLSNAATSKTTFRSRCLMQVFIHLSRQLPQTTDAVDFTNSLTRQQVSTALTPAFLRDVAKKEKVRPASLIDSVSVTPPAELGTFTLTVGNPNPKLAVRLTNAACDQLVVAIKGQRAAQTEAKLKEIKARIPKIQAELKRLEGIPAKRRTAADNAAIRGQRAALASNAALVADITSLPPDDISVLSRATNSTPTRTGSLSRNLIIALVAGLLACFLYILIGEIVVERRRARESTA